jgi:hypothetical protein
MAMKTLAVFVVSSAVGLTVLGGCSSTSDGWMKPGMTKEELGQDTANCLLDSSMVVAGLRGPRNTIDQDRYRRCMADRGYTAGPAN